MSLLTVTNSLTYSPFAVLGKPKHKKMNVEEKNKRRERFAGKCRVCGAPLTLVKDTNVMICSNEECKGRAIKTKAEDGTTVISRIPTYRCIEDKFQSYAEFLFEN